MLWFKYVLYSKQKWNILPFLTIPLATEEQEMIDCEFDFSTNVNKLYNFYSTIKNIKDCNYIRDRAWENKSYLYKIHLFILWYISFFLYVLSTIC